MAVLAAETKASAESELSSANLSTSVTLRVFHSSMPKIAIPEKFDFKIFDRPSSSFPNSLKYTKLVAIG